MTLMYYENPTTDYEAEVIVPAKVVVFHSVPEKFAKIFKSGSSSERLSIKQLEPNI